MTEVKNKAFNKKIRVYEALNIFLRSLKRSRLNYEEVRIIEGLGRVLAEDVQAHRDIPHYDRSAVDGYAIRAQDTYGISTTNPVALDVLGSIDVGESPTITVGEREAVKISTGAPVPKGANAVVMQEYTKMIGKLRVEIYRPVTPGKNLSRKGEDVKKGEVFLRKSIILQPEDIGILAAAGKISVKVLRKPKAAIISTGNELVEPGDRIGLGKTVDVNRSILSAAVRDTGGEPLDLGIARNGVTQLRLKILEGLDRADIVLVSGGTSVGKGDIAAETVDLLGKPGLLVHGIAMRPGMPTALASIDGKPVILLSGFPVAALMGFNTFARPVITGLLGISIKEVRGQVVYAKMARRVPSMLGMREFVRVVVTRDNEHIVAEPVRTTGSGIISSMVKANGLLIIPEEKDGVEKNETVEITLTRPLEREELLSKRS